LDLLDRKTIISLGEKELNQKKYRLTILLLVFAVIISASIAAFQYLPSTNVPVKETRHTQFPSGIPSVLGINRISATGLQQEGKTILVSGSGTASDQADEATVILGVQTEGETASEASRQNAELMTSVINAIKNLGLTEEDMKTVSYSIYPVYSKDDYTQIVGYRVINTISVKVTDINLVGAIIDAATENGANRIQGVSFGLSAEKREELKRQAYLSALKDAESKASLIAETLGLTITGVYSVSESMYQPYQPYYEYRFDIAEAASTPTPILEGKLSVSVTVQVAYSFE